MIHQMEQRVAELRPYMEAVEWENPRAYANWLSQVYYMVQRSVPLLGLCLYQAHEHPEFQNRCIAHISEEKGHDKMVLNDLKRLGECLQPELPMTASIYQSQQFRIVTESPLSFLGYIFWLELLAPAYGPYIMNRVSNKQAVSFLKVHAAEDEDHIKSAFQVLETLPENLKRCVLTNFEMTAANYKFMLMGIAGQQAEAQLAA